MKSLQTSPRSSLTLHTDDQIVHACQAAAAAEVNYAFKALVAGQMLLEKRHSLGSLCHGGKPSQVNGRNQHSEGDNFTDWLDSTGIASRTAYRWMDCADRVMRCHLGIAIGQASTPYIDIEGVAISHSQILTLPEAELPEAARELRQNVFDFMQDKSLGEAARAAFGGDSPSHRITRAANGKTKGGTNARDDRKAWDKFIASHLSDVTGLLGCNEKNREKRWAEMTAGQREKIQDAISTALVKWPTPLVEHVARQSRDQLKLR